MKIPNSVYVVLHTRACARFLPEMEIFKSLSTASNHVHKVCNDRDRSYGCGRIYGCRLIRFDRQSERG